MRAAVSLVCSTRVAVVSRLTSRHSLIHFDGWPARSRMISLAPGLSANQQVVAKTGCFVTVPLQITSTSSVMVDLPTATTLPANTRELCSFALLRIRSIEARKSGDGGPPRLPRIDRHTPKITACERAISRADRRPRRGTPRRERAAA